MLAPLIHSYFNEPSQGWGAGDLYALICMFIGVITFILSITIYAINYIFKGKINYKKVLIAIAIIPIVEYFIILPIGYVIQFIVTLINSEFSNGTLDAQFSILLALIDSFVMSFLYFLLGKFYLFNTSANPKKPALIFALMRLLALLIFFVVVKLLMML